MHLEPTFCYKRSHRSEKPVHHNEESPNALQLEKSCGQRWRPKATKKLKKKKRIVYIISNCIVNEGPLSPCGYLHLHSLKLNTIWKSISQLMAAFQGVDSPWLVAVKELPRWLSGKESACQCRRHGSRGEEEMATHSGILAWKIPWTKEPGELQFMCSQRVRHDWAQMW